MPELRWQDIPLGLIFKLINIIPHTLVWQTVVLWMPVGSQYDAVSIRPGTASSTAGAQAELGSGRLTVQDSRGILERFYSTDYMEAERVARQACSQVLQVSYGGTVSCLRTRHQCLPPIWRSLKIPQSKGYSQCICGFPSLGSRPWKITYHRGKYGSQIKQQLYLIWMPGSSFFKREVIF